MRAIHAGHESCAVRSVAAGEIAAAVIAQVRALLRAPEIRARAERLAADIPAAEVRAAMDGFDALWDELFPAEQARLLQLLVDKILLLPDGAEVRLRAEGLASIVADLTAHRQRSAAA